MKNFQVCTHKRVLYSPLDRLSDQNIAVKQVRRGGADAARDVGKIQFGTVYGGPVATAHGAYGSYISTAFACNAYSHAQRETTLYCINATGIVDHRVHPSE